MSAIDVYLSRPWTKFQSAKPGAFEVPLQSVTQAFDAATERDPGRTAVVFYGRSITYRELREATDRLANALASLGLKKGDRIALYLVNSPQFIIAYFAALKCGATVTPISPVYTSHEVRHQIQDSGARAVVCQDILYEKVEKSGAQLDFAVLTNVGEYLPALKRLFGKKADVRAAANLHWMQDLLKKHPPQAPAVSIEPKADLAALPYTGGTTGNPKGVMLTHYNLVAAQAMSEAAFRLSPGKVGLDAATIAGLPEPTGATATGDVDAVLAACDAVAYMASGDIRPDDAVSDIERCLRAGAHVVTPSLYSLYDPASAPPDWVQRLTAAATDGTAALLVSGVDPGWANDALAVTAAGLEFRFTKEAERDRWVQLAFDLQRGVQL